MERGGWGGREEYGGNGRYQGRGGWGDQGENRSLALANQFEASMAHRQLFSCHTINNYYGGGHAGGDRGESRRRFYCEYIY